MWLLIHYLLIMFSNRAYRCLSLHAIGLSRHLSQCRGLSRHLSQCRGLSRRLSQCCHLSRHLSQSRDLSRPSSQFCGLSKHFTGDSFRIGAATTAAECRNSTAAIKLLGRWYSSAFKSYIRPDFKTILNAQQALSNHNQCVFMHILVVVSHFLIHYSLITFYY